MIYWWVYYCFLKWNIVNRRLGSLPLSENGVLPIHVPEHSHSHLLNGDADQNKGTSRLNRSLAIEEGMDGISYPIILYSVALTRCWDPRYCLHFISHGPQLPKNSHSLVRCPSMSRWLDLRGCPRSSSNTFTGSTGIGTRYVTFYTWKGESGLSRLESQVNFWLHCIGDFSSTELFLCRLKAVAETFRKRRTLEE